MNYHSVVQPTRVGLAASSSTPIKETTFVVFVHMRKHAGTSIRRMFQSQGTWQLLPYCLPWPDAVQRALRSNSTSTRHMFLELHCHTYLPKFANMINASRKTLATAGHSPLRVMSFTVLRNPIDLILSEHNFFGRHAFSHSEWVRTHPEDFLYSPYHLNLRRGKDNPQHSLDRDACAAYEKAALHALEPFDHVAFVEEPSSMQWIAELAKVPDDHRNTTGFGAFMEVPFQNAACKYCHDGNSNGNTVLRWNNESITLGKLRELAARENRCSMRVYETIRATWDARARAAVGAAV